MRLPRLSVIALLAALPLLASCDLLGIESGEAVAARNEAEGKAIGSACRHAMRAIEDCYTLNPKAVKASVYTGWREMDEYMRENKIEGIKPVVPRPGASKPAGSDDDGGDRPADKASDKPADKAADKGAGH